MPGALFRYDPAPALAESAHHAIRYWARLDLLGERGGPLDQIWQSSQAAALLHRQRPDGSWRYATGQAHTRPAMQYDLLETYRALGELVEKFGVDHRHPALRKAAEVMLGSQAQDGDLRGIYGSQYSPNYTAGTLELLVKAGYGDDARVRRSFAWLLGIRQADGGWAIPLRTRGMNFRRLDGPTISPNPSRPFSHLVTGIVLRALALILAIGVHPRPAAPPAWSPDACSRRTSIRTARIPTSGPRSASHSGSLI